MHACCHGWYDNRACIVDIPNNCHMAVTLVFGVAMVTWHSSLYYCRSVMQSNWSEKEGSEWTQWCVIIADCDAACQVVCMCEVWTGDVVWWIRCESVWCEAWEGMLLSTRCEVWDNAWSWDQGIYKCEARGVRLLGATRGEMWDYTAREYWVNRSCVSGERITLHVGQEGVLSASRQVQYSVRVRGCWVCSAGICVNCRDCCLWGEYRYSLWGDRSRLRVECKEYIGEGVKCVTVGRDCEVLVYFYICQLFHCLL